MIQYVSWLKTNTHTHFLLFSIFCFWNTRELFGKSVDMYVWYQDYCCKGDKKSWQWLEKAAPNYQGWLKKRLGYKWRSWFLASALGKNDLCLKNFRLKAETIFFLSLSNENYTKMLGILSQLCVLLMALTYCILLSTCTLCARLLSPILWDDQEDGAGSSFFSIVIVATTAFY